MRSSARRAFGLDRLPISLRRGPITGRRSYSAAPEESYSSTLPDLDPSKLEITETNTPKDVTPSKELVFGRSFTGLSLTLTADASKTHCITTACADPPAPP